MKLSKVEQDSLALELTIALILEQSDLGRRLNADEFKALALKEIQAFQTTLGA